MIKRFLFALVSIFAAWTVIDLVLHRFVLGPLYSSTPALWRPASELNLPLIYGVVFVLIASFFLLFERLVSPKTLGAGLQFGAILGVAIGVSVGFGTYIHMPVPLGLAWGWFLGGWVKALAAGAILGALPRP
jgi:hypothetical protein